MGLEEFPVDLFISLLSSGDWSDGKDDNIGDIFTSIVVVGSIIVGGGLGDFGRNLFPVGKEVLGQLGDKSNWVGKDGGPGLDLLDIILDAFAVLEVLWEFLNNHTELLNSLDHILDVTLGEVGESIGDLNLELLTVSEALLDLWKIILLDEAIHDSGNEFLGTFDVHGVVSGDDASSGLNEFHLFI